MRLDLGCGKRCKESFIGVDIAPVDKGYLCDLFKTPWRFYPAESMSVMREGSLDGGTTFDGIVDEVNCSHLVEHVPDLCAFMNELGRVMKPGGIATITAPFYTSIRAWQDPTHVRAICDATWWYFDKSWRERNGLDHYPITCDFEYLTTRHGINPTWEAEHPGEKAEAVMHRYWNVIEDLEVTLRKREPAGTP